MVTRKSILSKSKVIYPIKYKPFYQITPYKGCFYDCYFCYNKFMMWIDKENWNKPEPITNASELLAKEIIRAEPGTIMISFMTDCYQPLEKEYEITQKCLKVILKYIKKGWHVIILTKSDLILRDLELIKKFGNNIEIGFTIVTKDPISEKHVHPDKLIDALKIFHENKVKTFLSIEPIHEKTRILEIFEKTYQYCDKYILGNLNYFKDGKRNVVELTEELKEFLVKIHKHEKIIHLKEELTKYINKTLGYSIVFKIL